MDVCICGFCNVWGVCVFVGFVICECMCGYFDNCVGVCMCGCVVGFVMCG